MKRNDMIKFRKLMCEISQKVALELTNELSTINDMTYLGALDVNVTDRTSLSYMVMMLMTNIRYACNISVLLTENNVEHITDPEKPEYLPFMRYQYTNPTKFTDGSSTEVVPAIYFPFSISDTNDINCLILRTEGNSVIHLYTYDIPSSKICDDQHMIEYIGSHPHIFGISTSQTTLDMIKLFRVIGGFICG